MFAHAGAAATPRPEATYSLVRASEARFRWCVCSPLKAMERSGCASASDASRGCRLLLVAALQVILLLGGAEAIPQYTITTFAGSGSSGSTGDGGPATAASFILVQAVVVDAGGSVYIADASGNRVRVVTNTTRLILAFAGNGAQGHTGDGGPATNATMNSPNGMALDGGGNVYVTEGGGNCVRMINKSNGSIFTVAGTGTAAYSGDGGQATLAQLNNPSGVAVDGGSNIYIVDSDNQRVRFVAKSTGIISTLVGTGISGYNGDGVPATSAQLSSPSGIVVDSIGNVFIADNNRVRFIPQSTRIISTYADTGITGVLSLVRGLALDSIGNLFIANSGGNRVMLVYNVTSYMATVAGNGDQGFLGDGGDATSAQLHGPIGITVDSSGGVYIADRGNARVRYMFVVTPSAATTFSGTPTSSSTSTRTQTATSSGTPTFTPTSSGTKHTCPSAAFLDNTYDPTRFYSVLASVTNSSDASKVATVTLWKEIATGNLFLPLPRVVPPQSSSFTTGQLSSLSNVASCMDGETCTAPQVMAFRAVRIVLSGTSASINTTDFTFGEVCTTPGYAITSWCGTSFGGRQHAFGQAASCCLVSDIRQQAVATVDLRDTPFTVFSGFNLYGVSPIGNITYDAGITTHQQVLLSATGGCGYAGWGHTWDVSTPMQLNEVVRVQPQIVSATLASMQLNGDAMLLNGSIVLVPAETSKLGSAYISTPIAIESGFVYTTKILRDTPGCNGPGDGLAIVIHRDLRGATALGACGGGLGYLSNDCSGGAALTPAVGLSLFWSGITGPSSTIVVNSVAGASNTAPFNYDGVQWTVRISYDGGMNLTVVMTRTDGAVWTLFQPVNVTSALGCSTKPCFAWFGASAGTGEYCGRCMLVGEAAPLQPPPDGAAFGSNNLAVLRVGSGAAPISQGIAQSLYIDEFSINGSLVQSMMVYGANLCTLSAFNSTTWAYSEEGIPSLSTNGAFVTFPCYQVAPGTPLAVTATKVAALVSFTGAVSTSTNATISTGVGSPSVPFALRTIVSDGVGVWWALQSGTSPYSTMQYQVLGTNMATIQCDYTVYLVGACIGRY